ncbi:hypothetical protein ACFL1R_06825 [Candidatus Latescibacterota bacterium]
MYTIGVENVILRVVEMKFFVFSFLIALITLSPVESAVIKGKITVSAEKIVPLKSSYSRGVFEPKLKNSNDSPKENKTSGYLKVVVWAEPVGKKYPFIQPEEMPLLKQQNKTFIPDLLVVQEGTIVGFPNLDPLYHNVFSYSQNKRFDLGRYKQGKSKDVLFDKEGVVEVFCEIHENMHAYIIVVNTPFFTTVDKSGEFLIEVPSGIYNVKAWSPSVESGMTKVDLTDTEEIIVNFSF